jgi:hypothetical protein
MSTSKPPIQLPEISFVLGSIHAAIVCDRKNAAQTLVLDLQQRISERWEFEARALAKHNQD